MDEIKSSESDLSDQSIIRRHYVQKVSEKKLYFIICVIRSMDLARCVLK